MQGVHQPAINVDSLHVEDGLLTDACNFTFFYIKISHQPSVRVQRVCISIRSPRRGDTARAKRSQRAEGERPTEGQDGWTSRRTFLQDGPAIPFGV